ncbi:MAG: DUF5693 family protein [Candidatus Margulisbacteria bacterium]|jgi:hypothetical protein|nr:DUF5693 family protein [Candidatus Margulisiibacteriota bacterium]
MIDKLNRAILLLVLTAAVLLGAYLGLLRLTAESGGRAVELVLDLNDLKKMAAFEKKPIGTVLQEVRALGITELGVFEETLPDGAANGELFYVKGSGLLRLKERPAALSALAARGLIKPDRTYVYLLDAGARRRVADQLRWALGDRSARFLGRNVLELDELEEDLRLLGLGLSEVQLQYLRKFGFTVVPRVWNDPHYHLGNLGGKIEALRPYGLVIFDGEELLGYPDAIPALADALRKSRVNYGYVEIVKQEGDQRLKKLMGQSVVRVHSVPKDELAKIDKAEALDRFVRAVRERGVRLIYLRPFLPPQIDAFPVAYNLRYFRELTERLQGAGFTLGRATAARPLTPQGWQIILLGAGVLCGSLFLLDRFIKIPGWLSLIILLGGVEGLALAEQFGQTLLLQKGLAFLASLVFPSYAVIANLSGSGRDEKQWLLKSWLVLFGVVLTTGLGIILMIGLLADSRFLSGIEVFPAVKLALTVPLLIVAAYFLRDRLRTFLSVRVSLLTLGLGLCGLGAVALLVARSGNFIIPVPGVEKYLRNWLEIVMFVRPRTKEFLIGYPALMVAALCYWRGNRTWLWLAATVGAVASTSVFNTFSHIHTPLLISLVRTLNALCLGAVVGALVALIAARYIKAEE